MKKHKKTEVSDAEGDQIMTDVGAEQNSKKKDKKKKRLQEVKDDGDEKALMDDIEEMEKERKAEKKKRKKEKRERKVLQNGKDDSDEKELMNENEEMEKERKAEKKKRKKEKRERKLLQNGKDDGDEKSLMDESEEMEKERKAERKTRKKEKRERKLLQNGKEMEKQMDEAVILGNKEMEVELNRLLSDDKGKKKKRKEKKNKGDTVAVDEEHNAVSGKKGKKKGNANITEASKADNKKRKRKEKETVDDMDKGAMEGNKKRARAAGSSENVVPRRKSKKVGFSDEVTVFPLSDNNECRSDLDEDRVVRGKRFTKEEDELVIKAVKDFVKRKKLQVSEEEGVRMVMNSNKHPEVRFCWKEIAEAIPWRRKDSICHRAHILLDQLDKKKEWTNVEKEQLRVWFKEKGPKWREMGDELGRHRKHVKDVVRRIGLVDKNKGHWSQEEYQKLFDLVNKDLQMKVHCEKKSKHGMLKDDIAWGAISDALGTRSMHICCMKWYGQLVSPMVEKDGWLNADDYFMMEALVNLDASCEEEVDWDLLLPPREEVDMGDLCRKRWTEMSRHLGKHGNITFSEQVEILSKRYCPDLSEIRETLDARPIVD